MPHPRLLNIDDDPETTEFMTVIANDVDILVPTRNGLGLLGTLHKLRYSGKVILMSAVPPQQLRMAAALPKPLRRLELREVLEGLSGEV